MAAFETRADIVAHHAYYLTVLPLIGERGEQIESWVGAVVDGAQAAMLIWDGCHPARHPSFVALAALSRSRSKYGRSEGVKVAISFQINIFKHIACDNLLLPAPHNGQ